MPDKPEIYFMKSMSKTDSGKDKPGVEINRDWCKGCGICVAFCPKEALALDEHDKAFMSHPESCNACGICELRCPDMAIEAS